MAKSTPSLLALLGLVAYAGYQNRDRIGDMLTDARQSARQGGTGSHAGSDQDNFLSDIGQKLQTGLSGSGISGALADLVAQFKGAGRGDAAESWVSTDANRPLNVDDMRAAIGPDTLDDLARKTGLSQAELLLRLNAALPEVVNRLTPNGRLPTDAEAQTLA